MIFQKICEITAANNSRMGEYKVIMTKHFLNTNKFPQPVSVCLNLFSCQIQDNFTTIYIKTITQHFHNFFKTSSRFLQGDYNSTSETLSHCNNIIQDNFKNTYQLPQGCHRTISRLEFLLGWILKHILYSGIPGGRHCCVVLVLVDREDG